MSWSYLSGIKIDRWEANTLMSMSTAYVEYTYKAKEVSCPVPTGALYLFVSEEELAMAKFNV